MGPPPNGPVAGLDRVGPPPPGPTPQCWFVEAYLTDGAILRVYHGAPPPLLSGYARLFNPAYLSVLVLAAAAMAFVVAKMAAAPLRNLAVAAGDLGMDLDRPALKERGPTEVRLAIRALNGMQTRLRTTLSERTRMLASITHDLQTPLTRMRLRLEKVGEDELRERLTDDLTAMQSLIREGLDYARSAHTSEDWSIVDLDSLLEALVEDAAEAGDAATFTEGAGLDVRVRPEALRRCLRNLIDNAIVYGGDAEVSYAEEEGRLIVRVRDHGPGISSDELQRVFEPFYRLEGSRSRETGGTGLGLAIAHALAEKNGAYLELVNLGAGGLEARLIFPAASIVANPHDLGRGGFARTPRPVRGGE